MTHRVLTAGQMQKVDADTIAGGVPGLELMERAGRGVADIIARRYVTGRAAIFVGPGNNGGDGLVVARHLVQVGWSCSIHLVKPGSECSPDTAANYARLAGLPRLVESDATSDDFRDTTLMVDSIFGTGFAGVPRDRAGEMIALVNRVRATRGIPVVSIDIPSGVNGTTGAVEGDAVRADLTVTIGAAKTGLLFHPGRSCVGELHVIDIGFPAEIIEKHSDRSFYLARQEAAAMLTPHAPDIHKYRAGTVLLVAGSERFRGAPLLAGEAALRAGCGMLYLAVPESIQEELPAGLREAIVIPLPQTTDGTVARGALDVFAPHVEKATAIAIGPGLGRNDETDALVRELVVNSKRPVVADADALTAFAGRANELTRAKSPVVITPHDGELTRLTGERIPTPPVERIAFSRATAQRLGVTLVHKGAPTLIAGRGGEVWINGSGTSALAKAGTGDVLTGFVVSLLAQAVAAGREPTRSVMDAACAACFLHGRAGEMVARERGERGVIASDLFDAVGRAMVELESAR